MFYYLTGKLVHVGDGVAVLDVGGVGYKLTVSSTTLGSLPSTSGEPTVRLYTHFSVREDAVELYGFYTLDELDTFRLLTAISGVGPKAAMSILSQLSPSTLADAVAAQNVKLISRAPGVGTKTAQRIVLELSGKIVTQAAKASQASLPKTSAISDAQEALIVLGYTRAEAQSAIASIDGAESKTTEELIRLALSGMAKI